MPGLELQRLGTRLEFDEGDNRRETTMDLGALVAAEAPNVLRENSGINAKERMREDGLLARFFVLTGFEVTVYRLAALFQLVLVSLSFGFDFVMFLDTRPWEGKSDVWSLNFLVAFVSNCLFLVDIFVRVCLGSSPGGWAVVVSVGSCIGEPHFLPASILRYQGLLYGLLCAVAILFRFVKGSIIVVPVTGVLWVLIFLFAAGACPISMLYGLLLRCNIITFSTKMRNFLINHNQDKCRFASCCLTVYVETPEAQDAPRVW